MHRNWGTILHGGVEKGFSEKVMSDRDWNEVRGAMRTSKGRMVSKEAPSQSRSKSGFFWGTARGGRGWNASNTGECGVRGRSPHLGPTGKMPPYTGPPTPCTHGLTPLCSAHAQDALPSLPTWQTPVHLSSPSRMSLLWKLPDTLEPAGVRNSHPGRLSTLEPWTYWTVHTYLFYTHTHTDNKRSKLLGKLNCCFN